MSKQTKPVRAIGLKITNILGIAHTEITPGNVTVVEGRNGLGKSSFIESIKAIGIGGHDATLLRNGEESGEIVLVLSDGVEIRKTVTAGSTDVKITHPDFGNVPKPRDYIQRLLDSFSLNPVEFLTAKPDKRVELLLGAIPMTVDKTEIAEELAMASLQIDTDQHALQVLSALEKDLYQQRRDVNRNVKEKRTTAAQMAKSITVGDVASCEAALKAAESALSEAMARHNAMLAEAENMILTDRRNAYDSATKAIESVQGKYRDQIAALEKQIRTIQAEMTSETEDLRKSRDADEAGYEANLKEARNRINGKRDDELPPMRQAVADAQAAVKSSAAASAARKLITEMENGAARAEEMSTALTEAMDRIDTVKKRLVSKMPIDGLTVDGTNIFIDGVPFERLNEARRVRLAFDVAMLRAGSLPMICIDGAERLDSASLEAIEAVAAEMHVQLFMARVSDTDLRIRTDEELAK